jgi:pimeloyl-ACP methyl ester carboxylesterase
LPAGYRSIAYSRRYNYPNDNPLLPDHSARVEADDVAALIRHLNLTSAHVVGLSYGGLTALNLASKYPNLVRSVTVAEPALLAWLSETPGGQDVLDDFMQRMWQPAGDAFRAAESDKALRVTVDYFAGAVGAYDQIPAEFKTALRANLKEWEALTTSGSAFAAVSRSDVQRLRVPVMILTGEKTKPIFKLITAELARVTPGAEHIVIPGGTHDMCSEQPQVCAAAIAQFIVKRKSGLTSR